METTLDKFKPIEAGLNALAKKNSGLKILGIDDKTNYELVHKAEMECVKQRTDIEKLGKSLRDPANQFAKSVIEEQNRLIAIIKPIEDELKAEKKRIDDIKEKIKEEKLQERINRLQAFNYTPSNLSFVKDLSEKDFEEYIENIEVQYNKYMEEKEAERLRLEEQQAIEEEKRKEERRLFEEQQAIFLKEQNEARIKREEEQRILKEQQDILDKKEQKIKDEQNRLELQKQQQERLEAQMKLQKEQEDKRIKEEQELDKKRQEYNKFLLSHGYNKDDENFTIVKTDTQMKLYGKLLGTFNYK